MVALQVNALFKKAAPAPAKKAAPAPKKGFGFGAPKKAAPAPKKSAPKKTVVRKAAPVKKSSGSGAAQAGSDLSKWYGQDRRLYLPAGLLDINTDVPSYLDGTLAGDYGFDPLKLGADGKIEQYRVAEVIHGRWAMLAIPGIVVPEALGIPGGVWTETGKVFLDGETGRPEILGNPYIFTAIEVALMAAVEGYRSGKIEPPAGFAPFYGKFESSDFSGLDPINPGGPLDFFNVASTPEDLAILKVKEIKNARLAMIAMLGVFVQGAVTAEGPATNWGKHVADPFGYNFVTISAVERTPVL